MTTTICIKKHFGSLCANGDKALAFLENELIPLSDGGEEIIFDFVDVRNMNSSFSNALFANLVMKQGVSVMDRIKFKNCRENIKTLVKAALDFGSYKEQQKNLTGASIQTAGTH